MSAWVEGKLVLNCSIDILRKAIIKIHPEWEDNLIVNKDGTAEMFRFNGQRAYNGTGGDNKAHIIIPGSGHPNIETPKGRGSHNDWGFKRNDNGTWDTIFADFGLAQAEKLAETVKGEIAIMKAKAIAAMKGYDVLQVGDTEQESYIEIKVDSAQYLL